MNESEYKLKILQLETQIEEYETLIDNFESASSNMFKIIAREITRVTENIEKSPMNKDDLKKFEVMVKCYDLLKKSTMNENADNLGNELEMDEEIQEALNVVKIHG